jgi:RNase adaptor protein for sRNA GlmZ degradation
LRKLDGIHPEVKLAVRKSRGFEKFYYYHLNRVREVAAEREPIMVEIGCMGGKHRSVAIGEMLARDLSGFGYEVDLSHTSPAMEGW